MSDSVKVVCPVGTFVLTKGTDGTYEGAANGVRCSVRGLDVTIAFGNRKDAFRLNNTLGSSLKSIGDRITAFCRELLYNDDKDVRYLDTPRGKVAYYQYNTHLESTPIIFVHGGPGDGGNTKRARELLLEHPLIVYDQMGCGRSDRIKDLSGWNHETFADELCDLIDGLGLEKVILIGESWGAGLSALYAIRTGCKKIESMVLISPFLSAAKWHEEEEQRISLLDDESRQLIENFNKGLIPREKYVKAMGNFYARYFLVQPSNREVAFAITDEPLDEVKIAMMGEKDFVVGGNMKDFDIVSDISKISCRTLILCGDSDVLRVQTAESYRDAIEESELVVVPNAGHLMTIEQTKFVSNAIREFIDKNKP